MNCISKYKKEIVFICILGLFFCLRLIKLDLDLPPWGVVNYQPMDEGQYATMALNKYNYGSLRLDNALQERQFMTAAHVRNNIVGNVLVYIGMILFGDNYYGFRCSSVLVAFLNFILFGLILNNLKQVIGREKQKNRNTYILYGILFLFATDFVYTVASRTVETTIYRMTCLQLMIWVLTFPAKSELYKKCIRFILTGFLAVFSVFAIYITNIFMVFAVFLMVVLYGIQNGKSSFFEAFSAFVAGSGIAYVVCDLYYNIVWGTSNIVNTMQIVSDFSGTNGYTGGNSLVSFFTIFLNFLSSNSNLYNIGILFLFLVSIPLIIKMIIKERNEAVTILFVAYMMFLLQTFINEDYIVRKYILVVPIVFYLIYSVAICTSKKGLEEYFKNNKVFSVIYTIACACICMGIVIYRLYFISNETYLDFENTDKGILLTQLLFIVLMEALILLIVFRDKINIAIATKLLVLFVAIGCLIPNIYFNLKYVYLNNSYTEKETMQKIGNYADDEWVYGIYSIAFTLYNDIKPIVNYYDNMGYQIVIYGDNWYLDYSDYMFPQEVMHVEKCKWREPYVFDRNFSTFGDKRSVSLYKVRH